MQNIDVRFRATTNFKRTTAEVLALESAAERLNGVLAATAYAKSPMLVDPSAWQRGTGAVTQASNAYRAAASSSGVLTTQQIRATTEAEKYTKALQKQKLSMGDIIKNRGVVREMYRDQLRYQRMTAQYWGTDQMGRAVTDITIPKSVPKDLDTMNARMGMFGHLAKSAGTQVVNLGKNMQWAGRQLMVGFTYPMLLFGAAAGMATYKAEEAFGNIKKVYDFSAAAANDSALREKEANQLKADSFKLAEEAAKRYGASLGDTFAIEQRLAATGLKGEELMGTTAETLRISRLGDIDPEQTADMLVSLKTVFKEETNTTEKLANTLNYLNSVSNATSLSLQDISEGIPRAANAMKTLGGDTKDLAVSLVAMREAGINATEGSNAVKSLSTRIAAPVPKAVKFYKDLSNNYKELKGVSIDLNEISNKSRGNILDFMKLLGEEQKKIKTGDEALDQFIKYKGLAALAGTYQSNRAVAFLTNYSDALGGVTNQTKKAIEIGELSNKQLAKQAELSRMDVMDNLAGKMKSAWEGLMIELTKTGEPFLKVATKFVEKITGIVKAFNGLSEERKKFIMWAAILAGIAGPLIMITGLFFNMVGQIVSGAGAIMRLLKPMKILTKEQWANRLATQAQNKELLKSGQVADQTALQVRAVWSAT